MTKTHKEKSFLNFSEKILLFWYKFQHFKLKTHHCIISARNMLLVNLLDLDLFFALFLFFWSQPTMSPPPKQNKTKHVNLNNDDYYTACGKCRPYMQNVKHFTRVTLMSTKVYINQNFNQTNVGRSHYFRLRFGVRSRS